MSSQMGSHVPEYIRMCMCWRLNILRVITYEQAVKEDMNKHSKAAYNQVEEVVQELHIRDHSFVATREGPPVPDKAHEEDDLIT